MIALRIDGKSGVPPYLQIAQQVRQALVSGVLRPGDQLPTVKDVVTQLGINPNTVFKGYRELEHEGLVEGRRGAGTFVLRRPPVRRRAPTRRWPAASGAGSTGRVRRVSTTPRSKRCCARCSTPAARRWSRERARGRDPRTGQAVRDVVGVAGLLDRGPGGSGVGARRRQRRGQDDADAAPRRAEPAHDRCRARRGPRTGRRSEVPAGHRLPRPGGSALPALDRSRPPRTRCAHEPRLGRAGRPRPAEAPRDPPRPAHGGVVRRDAGAGRACARARQAAERAAPRRTRRRARSTGPPRVPRLPRRCRRGWRRDGPDVEPSSGRSRAGVRPSRPHRRRATGDLLGHRRAAGDAQAPHLVRTRRERDRPRAPGHHLYRARRAR